MAQNRKRALFNPAGPFIARRNKPVGSVDLEMGKVYDAALFADLGPRRLQTLFDAYWFDMAPEDYEGEIIGQIGDPLDRDGDGKKGGDLTDAEIEALAAYGTSHKDWTKMPPAKQREVLQAAVLAAANPNPDAPESPETVAGAQEGENGGEDAPEAPEASQDPSTAVSEGDHGNNQAEPAASDATGEAEAGEAPVIDNEGDTATAPADPTPGPAAAYQNFGFGRWYAIDAAGTRIGDPVNKETAAGLASKAGVPTLGQQETLPGAK